MAVGSLAFSASTVGFEALALLLSANLKTNLGLSNALHPGTQPKNFKIFLASNCSSD